MMLDTLSIAMTVSCLQGDLLTTLMLQTFSRVSFRAGAITSKISIHCSFYVT